MTLRQLRTWLAQEGLDLRIRILGPRVSVTLSMGPRGFASTAAVEADTIEEALLAAAKKFRLPAPGTVSLDDHWKFPWTEAAGGGGPLASVFFELDDVGFRVGPKGDMWWADCETCDLDLATTGTPAAVVRHHMRSVHLCAKPDTPNGNESCQEPLSGPPGCAG